MEQTLFLWFREGKGEILMRWIAFSVISIKIMQKYF